MPKAVRYAVLVREIPSIPDWAIVFYNQAPFLSHDMFGAEKYMKDLRKWNPYAEYKVAEVHYEA